MVIGQGLFQPFHFLIGHFFHEEPGAHALPAAAAEADQLASPDRVSRKARIGTAPCSTPPALLLRRWHGDRAGPILPGLLHLRDTAFQRLDIVRKDPLGPDHALITGLIARLDHGAAGIGLTLPHDQTGNPRRDPARQNGRQGHDEQHPKDKANTCGTGEP